MPQGEWEQHRPRHHIPGVEPDRVSHPHPGGKRDFPSPRGTNRALGTDPEARGRGIVTTTVEAPGEPPQVLWELGLSGASECLVPNQHFEPLELKPPELPLKWLWGRRSWGRVKGPASSSGFSSQREESRDVRSASGKHTDINIYIYVPNFFWNIFIFLIYV